MAAGATAQCPLQLQPGFGAQGTDQLVRASTMWDPDGAGPAPARLVVAGSFTIVGSTLANRIAVLDPVSGTFAPLGSGLDGPVEALAAMPNGDLIAGGTFGAAGGAPAMWLARWNGTAWSAVAGAFHYFGGNTGYGVHALAVLPNGDLAVGGEFYEPTSGSYSLARWNGSAWSGFGSGISGATWAVHALAVLQNGDLAVAGAFATAGGIAANSIARWDGSTWSACGTGLDLSAFALAVLPNGDLVVGGAFSGAGGVPAVALARWNGSAWSTFGTGLGAGPSGTSVLSLTVLPGGDLLAGGLFATAGGVPCGNLARWNGASWATLASGISGSSAIVRTTTVLANGDVVAGGAFLAAGGAPVANLARWDGVAWSAIASGIDAPVATMCSMPNGDLVVGGSFTMIGGVLANRIARWNGAAWSPLGAGLGGPVLALEVMPNADLVAAGQFSTAGGAPASNLARWDGTNWSPLGAGVASPTPPFAVVRSLALLPNGDLVAGGTFTIAGGGAANNVARWNGTAWFPLGNGVAAGFLLPPAVNALATLPNGDLVAAGAFSIAGSVAAANIARWDGTAWSGLGTGWASGSPAAGSRIAAMLVLGNGDLLACGSVSNLFFAAGPLVQRWNGTTWTTLSGLTGAAGSNDNSAVVSSLALLPDGDVLAGGHSLQAGGVGGPPHPLVRWDGAAWATVPNAIAFTDGVGDLHVDGTGAVRAAGGFVGIGGVASAYLATFVSACPATVVVNGAGCTGSAGLTHLASTALPWIGSSWRALATGMPANAFALRVLGLSALSTPIPLTAILPQGGAGCTLYVTPDLVDVYVPLGPSVATELAIPDSLALVGIAVHQQVTPLVFTASGLVEYTATNALVATIGAL